MDKNIQPDGPQQIAQAVRLAWMIIWRANERDRFRLYYGTIHKTMYAYRERPVGEK